MSSSSLVVTVTDPVKMGDKLGAYIVYRVNTTTNSPEFNVSESSVSRRFSDFEWLHSQLAYAHPGSIIPPLPEKQTVGRFTPEFIESRRRGIEKFMDRVTKHKVLKESPCLVSFLQSSDSEFAQCKSKYKQERASTSGSVSSWLGDKINTMASSSGPMEETEDDINVHSALEWAVAWEKQLTTVAKHASAIVKSTKDKSKALFEFGQAFSSLGLNETNRELGDVLSNVGVAAAKLSSFVSDASLAKTIQFEEPMYESLRILHETKAAIKRRGDKRQNLLNGKADLEAKQGAYNKVLGVAGKEDVATAKLVQVETAQERVETAEKELKEVTEQLLAEVASLKVDKATEFKAMCREYVKVLIELNNNTETVWSDLKPQLKVLSKSASAPVAKSIDSVLETKASSPAMNKYPEASNFEEVEEEEDAPPIPAPSSDSIQNVSNQMNEVDIDDEDEAGV